MSTKHTKVKTMIDTLRKSDRPVTFASLCETAKEKYPQDVQAAMLALVEVGLVESGKDGRLTTYRWTGERPAPKRRGAKQAGQPADSEA
jgi:hypothetical protein